MARLQVATGNYALCAGMGANKLRGGSSGLVGYKKQPLIAATATSAVFACVHAYFGFKAVKDEADKAQAKVESKSKGLFK